MNNKQKLKEYFISAQKRPKMYFSNPDIEAILNVLQGFDIAEGTDFAKSFVDFLSFKQKIGKNMLSLVIEEREEDLNFLKLVDLLLEHLDGQEQ